MKQSVTIAYNEIDDIGEEDETEKNEFEEDAKIIPNFFNLNKLYEQQNKSVLIPIEAMLVSMSQNIQSPPPKF